MGLWAKTRGPRHCGIQIHYILHYMQHDGESPDDAIPGNLAMYIGVRDVCLLSTVIQFPLVAEHITNKVCSTLVPFSL